MNIRLNRIELFNIYNHRHLKLEFNGNDATILGKNGAGKSTIYDAFLWCLFGKDAENRPDFEIKPRLLDGEQASKIESIVILELEIDGVVKTFERNYHEKWQNVKGELQERMTGHTTDYKINGSPIKTEKEYKSEVASIIDEDRFRMITDVKKFMLLPWEKRREKIVELTGGDMTDLEFAEQWIPSEIKFKETILKALHSNKLLVRYKEELNANKKEAKSKFENIPARIDEVTKAMPEAQDWSEIESKISIAKSKIADIDASLKDSSIAYQAAANIRKSHIDQKLIIENKIANLKNEAIKKAKSDDSSKEIVAKIEKLKQSTSSAALSIENTQKLIDSKKETVKIYLQDQADLRKLFTEESQKTFQMPENECACPTCQRALDPTDLEAKKVKLLENFNNERTRKFQEINTRGVTKKQQIETFNAEIVEWENRLKETELKRENELSDLLSLETQLTNLPKEKTESEILIDLENNIIYKGLKSDIEQLEKQLAEPLKEESDEELNNSKKQYQEQISQLERELVKKESIKRGELRINELNEESKKFAQSITDAELGLYSIEQFYKAKMLLVEDLANKFFPENIKVQLFERRINEGDKPLCNILINGVPYPRANTASQINAGIAMINLFQSKYETYVPLFVDNRESVLQVIPTEAQLINLKVDESATKLKLVS